MKTALKVTNTVEIEPNDAQFLVNLINNYQWQQGFMHPQLTALKETFVKASEVVCS